MTNLLAKSEVWLVTGAQHLYGPGPLEAGGRPFQENLPGAHLGGHNPVPDHIQGGPDDR